MKSNQVFAIVSVVAAIILLKVLSVYLGSKDQAQSVPSISEEVLVRPHSFTKGPPNAPVTLVEFLDPECESCRVMHPIVKTLTNEYGDKVRLVIRYMPFHGNSLYAASALEEARELGKFEEALTTLFEKQPEWGSHHAPKPELIVQYLKILGIDEKRLDRGYLLKKHQSKIVMDQEDGVKAGIQGTPTFFVNGVMLKEIGYRPIKDAIERALAEKRAE